MTTATDTRQALREGDLVLYNGKPARVTSTTPCSPEGDCCEGKVTTIDGTVRDSWASTGSLVLVRPGDLKVGDRVRLVHQDGRTHDAEVTNPFGQTSFGAFGIDMGVTVSPRAPWATYETIGSGHVAKGTVRITRAEPEATTEARPFQVGDRVRLTRDIGGARGSVGTVGTVERGSGSTDSPSRGLAFRPDGATTGGGYSDGRYYISVSPEATFELVEAVKAEPEPLKRGDRVKVTDDPSITITDGVGGYAAQVWKGRIVEVVNPKSTFDSVHVRRLPGEGYGEHFIHPGHIVRLDAEPTTEPAAEPAVVEGDLAAAVARAERAERALQSFREQVRQAVIDEAAEQGWCDRTDSWLEEIGLEPREPESNAYDAYVDVELTIRVSVSVSGPDEEYAAEMIDTEMVQSALDSGAYSISDTEVQDYTVAYLN